MCLVFHRQLSASLPPILLVSLVLAALYPIDSSAAAKSPQKLPLKAVNGPQTTIVILVQFPDRTNSTSPSQISNALALLNDYYSEDSYSTVSFQYAVTPSTSAWYRMPNTMAYYGADTASSDNQLVQDALQATVNAGTNLANYKFAMIVHAGSDEAITHVTADIHSYTIQGFPFRMGLTTYTISSSVVAETDPMGVYAHESGHLLGLPDLYDVTQQIDPANNFLGYWEIMALGEWNPNNGNPLTSPGTYPSHHSAWSKIELGFIPASRIVTVNSGTSVNVTVQNLEELTSGVQAVKIPVAYDSQGRLTYYLIEMRAKLGVYDQYLPFPSTYPNAGLLIYRVNETVPNGSGSVKLIDAHPGGDLSDAPFGPCSSPCVSNNILSDSTNFVKVIVTTTGPTTYKITVDRTNSPQLLLQINTPSSGVLVSVDGHNQTTDSSNQLRLPVRYGPHTIYVQQQIPVSVGSTSVQIGLTNTFASWGDGGTTNPRGVSLVQDTVITALYRITVEPSLASAVTALIILGIVVTAVALHRRKRTPAQQMTAQVPPNEGGHSPPVPVSPSDRLFPGNDSLPGDAVYQDKKPEGS
ncbi:M6 family metalloprotease domain-containing protein [Candidatus Bathyarchaeota archaeon]|nr:MAG: M6 family metalloprotease domain-containing protein [Candidatus Bathyarchaeota archaeon]